MLNNLKSLRMSKGLSQTQLARELGVHQTAVSQWECDNTHPAASVIPKLLSILGCSYEDLYRNSDTPKGGVSE